MALDDACREQGNEDLVVADEGDAAAGEAGRPLDDVALGPVLAHEIEVHRRQPRDAVAQIAGDGERLQEDLGQDHGRADVEDDAVLQPGHEPAERLEVAVARLAEGGTVGARMHVVDVGADRDVDGDRESEAMGGREHRAARMGIACLGDVAADRRTHPEPFRAAARDRGIESLGRLPRDTEAPRIEGGADVLAGPAEHRELEIMDTAGPVHHQAADRPALHQIDDDRREPDLDEMGAEAEEDQPIALPGPGPGLDRSVQIGAREQLGQRSEQRRDRRPRRERLGLVADPDFALPPAGRLGSQLGSPLPGSCAFQANLLRSSGTRACYKKSARARDRNHPAPFGVREIARRPAVNKLSRREPEPLETPTIMAKITDVTDATFDGEVLQSTTPVLVDFWAEWCGPCRAIAPIVKELAEDYGDRLKVVKINIDDSPQTPGAFGIRSIPTILAFKDGKVVSQLTGARPKSDFVKLIDGVL